MSRIQTQNMHNLCHLADDVENQRCSLNDISAFTFENSLQVIKKYVCAPQNPITRVTKWMVEGEKAGRINVLNNHYKYILTKRKDNWIIFRTERFVFLWERRNDSYYVCDVLRCHHLEKLFRDPCESKLFSVVYINEENMNHPRRKVIHT